MAQRIQKEQASLSCENLVWYKTLTPVMIKVIGVREKTLELFENGGQYKVTLG